MAEQPQNKGSLSSRAAGQEVLQANGEEKQEAGRAESAAKGSSIRTAEPEKEHDRAEKERKEILNKYRILLRSCRPSISRADKKLIRRAFDLALEAHAGMRRKSGEPYIIHPLNVAIICAREMNLGSTSIVCALLHDVVEDTHISLDEIQAEFGRTVTRIIDGLTKISGLLDHSPSPQAENFRKMLLTLADDIRVILVKLADRLHNMRTMESMPRDKQLKIASETSFLYAPLAHRLGLYNVKSELEDLSMKYTNPAGFRLIARKLAEGKAQRSRYISDFIRPIKERLSQEGVGHHILYRTKSIHSIWQKMQKKGVSFEEVYDLFAIRIILDVAQEKEKQECWRVYSMVTDIYPPNPDRLRDWISLPKTNGYESLHTTVMGPRGRWVEIQIRTERMDELAEKGLAAHWKYKEGKSLEKGLDEWLRGVREMLNNPDGNALEFLDDFKLNLFTDEIYVFTPKGDLVTLPKGASVLDFAFSIHTEVGRKCIGGKVNQRLVAISHALHNGDQVEILTSARQKPKEDWLQLATTARARSKIKHLLKEAKRALAQEGKEILERKCRTLKIDPNPQVLHKIAAFLRFQNTQDLFCAMAEGRIDQKDLKEYDRFTREGQEKTGKTLPDGKSVKDFVKNIKSQPDDLLLIGEGLAHLDYKMAPCCNPIPGDDVFGFITINEGVKIHRTSCPNAEQLMSSYGYRILKAKWTRQKELAFLTGLRIIGTDDIGVINNLTKIISNDFKVNMRSITVDSNDGVFEGIIMVYVKDTQQLDQLLEHIKKVNGIHRVERLEQSGGVKG